MNFLESVITISASAFRSSSPLIYAALGGICSERCGVVNIALEGKMLFGAFCAAAVTHFTHSAWIGFFCGGLAGLFLANIYALFVIFLRSNQIVAGTAITLLAMGVVPFISQLLFQNTGMTPEIPLQERFIKAPIILSWVLVVLIWGLFKYSPIGLWFKFAGEHPEALQTSGIDVLKTRIVGVSFSGFLAGLGGATLSLCMASNYTRNMTAGRGYMALAALIVGGWKPVRAAMACLLFGLFDAIGIMMQGSSFSFEESQSQAFHFILKFLTSGQFIQIIPYILTIIIVSGLVVRSRPPRALGQHFRK